MFDLRACALFLGYAAEGLFVDAVYEHVTEIRARMAKRHAQVVLFTAADALPATATPQRLARLCPSAYRCVVVPCESVCVCAIYVLLDCVIRADLCI